MKKELSLALLIILGLKVYWHYYAINIALFEVINGYGWNNAEFWYAITFLGDGAVAFSLLIFFVRRFPNILWQGFLIALVLGAFIQCAKHLCFVSRPAALLGSEHIHIIGAVLRHYSFPSGHALTAFAFAALLAHHLSAPWRAGLILLAALIGLSRVVVGAHWPLDVVIGGAIGWFGANWVIQLSQFITLQSRTGILFLYGVWLACAISLWVDTGHYPQAAFFVRALTVAGLLYWLIAPMLASGANLIKSRIDNKNPAAHGKLKKQLW